MCLYHVLVGGSVVTMSERVSPEDCIPITLRPLLLIIILIAKLYLT